MENLIKNNKIQKILLWLFLIAGAAICVAGLIYATNFTYFTTELGNGGLRSVINTGYNNDPDTYGALKKAWDANYKGVNATYLDFVDGFNSANTFIFISGVVIILLFAVICIFGNKYRKKYYLSNLLAGTILGGVAIALALVGVILNIKVMGFFNDNKTLLDCISDYYDVNHDYSVNLAYVTFCNIILIVSIVIFALNIVYTVLKFVASRRADLKSINDSKLEDAFGDSVENNASLENTSEEAKV